MWSGSRHDSTKVPLLLVGGLAGSLETGRVLDFRLAHALARDAVHDPLDVEVGRIIDESSGSMFRDDLKLIALRNAEALCRAAPACPKHRGHDDSGPVTLIAVVLSLRFLTRPLQALYAEPSTSRRTRSGCSTSNQRVSSNPKG